MTSQIRVDENPTPPQIRATDLMHEAGRKVLRFHLQRMLNEEPGTRLGDDIEALHDMRVAVRRMRAALRVFGSFFEKETRKWIVSGLRQTGRALGTVRDLDVLITKARAYREALPRQGQHELDPLLAHWHEKREEARNEMLAYLDSREYSDFCAIVTTFCETTSAPDGETPLLRQTPVHVAHVLPGLLYGRYGAVRAYENGFDHAPIASLHGLRIEARRLRYTLEFFRVLLGAEAEALIELAIRVQDHLGALNDANVACQHVRAFLDEGQKQTRPVEASPRSAGATSYLTHLESEIEQLRATAPDVWQGITSTEARRKLATSISLL